MLPEKQPFTWKALQEACYRYRNYWQRIRRTFLKNNLNLCFSKYIAFKMDSIHGTYVSFFHIKRNNFSCLVYLLFEAQYILCSNKKQWGLSYKLTEYLRFEELFELEWSALLQDRQCIHPPSYPNIHWIHIMLPVISSCVGVSYHAFLCIADLRNLNCATYQKLCVDL